MVSLCDMLSLWNLRCVLSVEGFTTQDLGFLIHIGKEQRSNRSWEPIFYLGAVLVKGRGREKTEGAMKSWLMERKTQPVFHWVHEGTGLKGKDRVNWWVSEFSFRRSYRPHVPLLLLTKGGCVCFPSDVFSSISVTHILFSATQVHSPALSVSQRQLQQGAHRHNGWIEKPSLSVSIQKVVITQPSSPRSSLLLCCQVM